MAEQLIIREISKHEIEYLKRALYNALYVHPGEKEFDRDIVNSSTWSKWYSNWGRGGDHAQVVEVDGAVVGAAWCRQFSQADGSFGFVSTTIPELTISIEKEYRGRGLGKRLLLNLIARLTALGYPGLSLNLDGRNKPAAALYQALGFNVVRDGSHPTMLLQFAQP